METEDNDDGSNGDENKKKKLRSISFTETEIYT